MRRLKILKKCKNNLKNNNRLLKKVSYMSMSILNEKNIVWGKCRKYKERPMDRPVVERSKTCKKRKRENIHPTSFFFLSFSSALPSS